MNELISTLKYFEGRNNISASVIVNSDGSFGLQEFWSEESLGSFGSIEELLKFLTDTQYALDEKGICIKPCQIK
jgi:hypothetical protein